ncbi:MAG: Beta-Lactamase protein [Myxococcaceae bacterium]|nr:Beta-Lactamase protein [Myxococcaceae bacterium]
MRGKRWLIIFLCVMAFFLAAKFVLLDGAASASAPYTIDLEALHEAAVAAGPLPTAVEVEHVADFGFPRTMVVAGGGFSMHAMILLAHRLVYPDGSSVVIDTAMDPKSAEVLPGAKARPDAFKRVEAALAKAKLILFTHEHVDHVGGIASAKNFASIATQSRITREQLNGPRLERDKFAPGTLEQLKPLDYSGLYTVAPGVVLQKAPGHSTGTQLIYVELESGVRFLFVGDIAWTEDNIKLQRGRPLLIELIGKEDRAAVASQVAALAALPKDVHLIVAHDPVAYERDVKAGLLKQGFSL